MAARKTGDGRTTSMEGIWEGCKLERRDEANKLLRLIENIHAAPRTKGHTLNIDAKWGEGKTFFLTRWKKQLQKNHLVVYWNAWETDFSQEPLLSLFSLIDELTVSGNTEVSRILDELKKILPTIAHVTCKIAYRSSIEELKDATDKLGEKIIREYEKEYSKILEIRKKLGALVDAIIQNNNNQLHIPIFILIDELDRCRPNYALLVLERIKHIFDVPGIQFVVATDTDQLSHTVKSVYGNGFDSHRYLKRFFDIQYTFKEVDEEPHANFLFDQENTDIKSYFSPLPVDTTYEKILCDFATMFNWSMRDRLQIFEKLDNVAKMIFEKGTLQIIPMLYFLGLNHKLPSRLYDVASAHQSVSSINDKLRSENDFSPMSDESIKYISKEAIRDSHRDVTGYRTYKVSLFGIIDFYLKINGLAYGELSSMSSATYENVNYGYEEKIATTAHEFGAQGFQQLKSYREIAKNLGGLKGWQGEESENTRQP